ncbi:MAG: hypothetical protein HKN36_08045 [Hellea sp.]|nr:hypothetical protein [Hellea sp.]
MSPSDAQRRYKKTTAMAMLFYVIVIFSVAFYLKRTDDVAPVLKYILAALPTIFVWWFLWGAIRFYKETDEYERSRLQTGMLFGVIFTMLLSSGWGFMEMFADAPQLPVFWIFPAFILASGVGRLLTKTQPEGC